MKVLSWNAQGYAGQVDKFIFIRDLLNEDDYDVICIQEAGGALGSFDQVIQDGNPKILECKQPSHPREVSKLHNYRAIYYRWGDTNFRCSMVTYVKKEYYYSHFVYVPLTMKGIRGCLGVTIRTDVTNIIIGNIHLISGVPKVAYEQFVEFRNHLSTSHKPFIIIGDFNIDAISNQPLISTQNHFYPIIINNQIIKTQKSGGCLDYAYSEIYPPSEYGILATPGDLSDHAPVFYIF